MIEEASQAPENGHGEETPSAGVNWLEEHLPKDMTFETEGDDGSTITKPLHEHPALAKYKNLGELAKGLVNAQQAIGRKTQGLVAPGESANDEDRAQFDKDLRRILGVPDGPDGYEVNLPENLKPDEGMMGWFKGAAHEIGLSPAQAQAFSDSYHGFLREYWEQQVQAEDARKAEAAKAVEAHWGKDAAAKVETARRGLIAMAGELQIPEAEATAAAEGIGDNIVMLRLFERFGKAFTEDTTPHGEGGHAGGSAKPKSAEQFFAEDVFGGKGE